MLDFLTALRVNNDRQWFGVHKEEYNDIRRQCLEEVGVLIAEIERFDPHLAGVAPEQCVYRIYRDIRFSADKSPYKTHFGVVLGHGGKKCKEAAYYLHIDPDGCAFFSGVWFPEMPVLRFLRRNIYDNLDEFLEIIDSPAFKSEYPGLIGESLKTLPKGYPKDCPRPEIFKMKEFLVQKKYKKSIKYLKKVLETNGEDYIAYYYIYKLYNILIKHEKDETKKEKYLNIANKSLKKSANLGYEKAINQLKREGTKETIRKKRTMW